MPLSFYFRQVAELYNSGRELPKGLTPGFVLDLRDPVNVPHLALSNFQYLTGVHVIIQGSGQIIG